MTKVITSKERMKGKNIHVYHNLTFEVCMFSRDFITDRAESIHPSKLE